MRESRISQPDEPRKLTRERMQQVLAKTRAGRAGGALAAVVADTKEPRALTDSDSRGCGGEPMELDEARRLLMAERTRVQQMLADLGTDRAEDESAQRETGDAADPAQPLAQQGVDDAVASGLRERLAALDRALQRVEDGSYGRSVRSGVPIPDERLEADPAAELTVQEAAEDQARDR